MSNNAWAWWTRDHPEHVFQSREQVELCSPDFFRQDVSDRIGALVPVVVSGPEPYSKEGMAADLGEALLCARRAQCGFTENVPGGDAPRRLSSKERQVELSCLRAILVSVSARFGISEDDLIESGA